MAALTPIAIADLGAGLDALLTATNVTGRHVGMSPKLLVACGRVTGAVASLRLYRYDEELLYWVPSAVAAASVAPGTDAGVFELRFTTAEISGRYALVKESGAGVVGYYFREGQA